MSRTPKTPARLNMRPVWADVSLPAIVHNYQAIREYVNPATEKRAKARQVLAIVKGNAYGHGGPTVAKALEKAGCDWFGVTCTEEGMALREAGLRKPVLVLTSFVPGEEQRLLQHNLTTMIHRCEQIALLERAAAKQGKRKVAFHLKVDTGMNRLGLAAKDVECFARQLEKAPHLQLGGTFTHFASSESFTDSVAGRQTHEQEEMFFAVLGKLRELGIDPGIVHLANSGAIVTRPETWADMVRPGAILYGYHPGYDPIEKRAELEKKLALRPAMSLRTRIISLRDVPAGAGVGYGSSFVPEKPARIAVLAAGYGDGIHRSLGNRGSVLIRGVLAPIVGIVSMDVTMIDVSGVPDAQIGDMATIYGTDGDASHPASLVARSIGTVTSDLLCAVSQRVPRVYLQ
jgi:alanine racemase